MATYLHGVADEADRRGYNFDRTRLAREASTQPITLTVTTGQLRYEFEFLLRKVLDRDPEWARSALDGIDPHAAPHHPLFVLVPGPVAEWEHVK